MGPARLKTSNTQHPAQAIGEEWFCWRIAGILSGQDETTEF
jgi:hypothetical protein